MAERSEEDNAVQIAERSMSGSEGWVHLLAIPRERHQPPRSAEGSPHGVCSQMQSEPRSV